MEKDQKKQIPGLNSISAVLDQFKGLDRVVIDTSSLIYLSKINMLHAAADALHLITVPDAAEAFGSLSEFKQIEIIDIKTVIGDKKDTDPCLIAAAKHLHLPVVSEKKKMLMQAKRSSLSFFNSLMILNFLVFKKVINPAAYQAALDRLRQEAYYHMAVFEYGKAVYEKIIEKSMDAAVSSTS